VQRIGDLTCAQTDVDQAKCALMYRLQIEGTVSIAEVKRMLGKNKLAHVLRTLLSEQVGLPVYISTPPPGVQSQLCSSLAFVMLKSNPKAQLILAAKYHEFKDQLHLLSSDVVANVHAVFKAAGRARDGHSAAYAALLTSLVGSTRARQLTGRSADVQGEMLSNQHILAELRDEVLAQVYEQECKLHQVAMGHLSTHDAAFKARVYRKAASIFADITVDRVTVDNEAQEQYQAAKAAAMQFVAEQHSRPSAHQTVVTGAGEAVPLMYLLGSRNSIFQVYKAQGGSIGRTSFLGAISDHGFKALPMRTCLCAGCEGGQTAVAELVRLCKVDEVHQRLIDYGAAEVVAAAEKLRLFLTRDYLQHCKIVVQQGNSLQQAAEALPMEVFDMLHSLQFDHNSDSLEVQNLCEQLKQVESAVREYAVHLERWGHQDVRFREDLDGMCDGTAVMVIDFKEKVKSFQTARQLQRDYFNNTVVSLFNATVFHKDGAGGVVHRVCYDYLSTDTDQDSFWVQSAFALLAEQLRADIPGLRCIKGWSDNGPHFHNSLFIQRSVKKLKETLGLSAIKWSFFEPGEGKCYCDTHFAHVADVFKRYVATDNDINGVDDIKRLLEGMQDTHVFLNNIDRDSDQRSYFALDDIKSHKYFVFDDTVGTDLLVSELTRTGHLVVMTKGHVVQRGSNVGKRLGGDTLTAALTRAGMSQHLQHLLQRGAVAKSLTKVAKDVQDAMLADLRNLLMVYPHQVKDAHGRYNNRMRPVALANMIVLYELECIKYNIAADLSRLGEDLDDDVAAYDDGDLVVPAKLP
jgi:hypothetical protein